MNSNDDVFHVLRQILAGIFLVGVLGFSIYQGVVFWKMWKTRREHPRVTEQEKQKKEDLSTEKNNIPTHVRIGTACGCSKESFALLEQIRTIDRIRLKEKVGTLSGHKMEQINQALSISVGLDPTFF